MTERTEPTLSRDGHPFPEHPYEVGDIISYRIGRADFGESIVLDPVAEDLLSNHPFANRTIPTRSTGGGAYSWVDPDDVYKFETVAQRKAAATARAIEGTERAAFRVALDYEYDDAFEARYGERPQGTGRQLPLGPPAPAVYQYRAIGAFRTGNVSGDTHPGPIAPTPWPADNAAWAAGIECRAMQRSLRGAWEPMAWTPLKRDRA